MASLRVGSGLALLCAAACTAPDHERPGPADLAHTTSGTETAVPPPPPPDTEVRVQTVAGPVCADPGARAARPFGVTSFPYVEPVPSFGFDGAGVGVGDFDRDGMLDALVLGHDREELLQQRAPGIFVAVEEGYMDPSIDLRNGFGAAVADYDADGDPDIFVTRYGSQNVLLRNDGTGYFTDAAVEAGVEGAPAHRSASAVWSDYDNDGDLDLYVAGHGEAYEPEDPAPPADPDYLYTNRGDGTFSDTSAALPARVHEGRAFVPAFVDLDGDGWRDLYLVNDLGGLTVPCLLVWNRAGTFVLDDGVVGLDQPVPGMGLGIGDVNEDGRWDFLVSAWGTAPLLISSPALGLWINFAAALGINPSAERVQVVSWGSELADMDDDGRLDAVAPFGELDVPGGYGPPDEPNALWIQGDDGSFTDVAPAWGFDHRGSARGAAVVDLDADGWLDVVLPDQKGPTQIYRATCGEAGWLEVSLAMPGTMNLDAIGATVAVRIGLRTLSRPVLAGGTSYGVGLPPVVHFGLGDAASVDAITVLWPDGGRSELPGVAARSRVTITRPE